MKTLPIYSQATLKEVLLNIQGLEKHLDKNMFEVTIRKIK